MRTCKIYSHSNFQIYNRVLLGIVTVLYVTSSRLIYLITESLKVWIAFTHFIHLSIPTTLVKHQSVLCIHEFFFFFLNSYVIVIIFVFPCLTYFTSHYVPSSVQSLSRVRLFATPWTAARQASPSITNSWSLPKLMSIESVMPSSHLILFHPLLFLPSIFPRIRVFSKELALCIR